MSDVVKNSKRSGKICAVVVGILFVLLMLVAVYNVVWKNSSVVGITDISEKQYQFSPIDTSQIMVEYDGLRGSSLLSNHEGSYVLSSPSYGGYILTVYINGKEYSTYLENYVSATGVEWSYKGKPEVPFSVSNGVVKEPEKFTCMVTYEDGTTKEQHADYAEVEWKNHVAYVLLLVGESTYYQEFKSTGSEEKLGTDKFSMTGGIGSVLNDIFSNYGESRSVVKVTKEDGATK